MGGILYPDNVRMEFHPCRGYAALRRFRESRPDAEYFLTINLAKRGFGLEKPALTAALIGQWKQLETEKRWFVSTATIMPDHLHLLIRLGEPGTLEECVKRLKGRLSPHFRSAALRWQAGFYDHRLRPSDDILAIFLSIYLNPYRADLIPAAEAWSGYYCCLEDWVWFGAMTRESVPHPAWLR